MSTNVVAGVPARLLTLLRHCPGCAAEPAGRRRDRRPAGRPAWQSPYGPAPHRAPRDRWVRAAEPARSRPALRRGHVCGRCD